MYEQISATNLLLIEVLIIIISIIFGCINNKPTKN